MNLIRLIAKQRDHIPEKDNLAIAVRTYVLGLDNIDFSDCPKEFTAAYKKHRDAWNDSVAFFEKHDSLRGEMHDLFDLIRKMDSPDREEINRHNDAIMSTWRDVETIATKYGIGESSSASIDLLEGANLDHFRKVEKWRFVETAKAVEEKTELATSVSENSNDNDVLINFDANDRAPYLFSKEDFGDVKLELEFMVPKKSNSGIYLMGRYEIQILDSFGVENPGHGDLGGVYQRWDESRPQGKKGFEGVAPKVNAAKAPGEWQTMEITFRAPRFDESGKKTKSAVFEQVLINGQLVQEDQPAHGPTRAAQFGDEKPTGPISIQGDHGPIAIRKFCCHSAFGLMPEVRSQFRQCKYEGVSFDVAL